MWVLWDLRLSVYSSNFMKSTYSVSRSPSFLANFTLTYKSGEGLPYGLSPTPRARFSGFSKVMNLVTAS